MVYRTRKGAQGDMKLATSIMSIINGKGQIVLTTLPS